MQSRVSRRYTAVFTRPSRSLWTWQRYLRGINEPGNRVQRNYLSFSHRGQIRAIVTRDPRVEDRSGDSIGIDRSSLKRERSRSRSRATASVLTSAGLQPLVYYSCPGLNRDWQRIWFRPLFGRFWKPYREFSTCFSCNQRKIKIVAFFSRLLFRPVIGYFWLRMRVRLEQMIFPRLVTRFSVTRRKKGAWRTKKKKKKEKRAAIYQRVNRASCLYWNIQWRSWNSSDYTSNSRRYKSTMLFIYLFTVNGLVSFVYVCICMYSYIVRGNSICRSLSALDER